MQKPAEKPLTFVSRFLCQFWNGNWNDTHIRTYISKGSAGSTPAAGMNKPRKSSILGGLRGCFFMRFGMNFGKRRLLFETFPNGCHRGHGGRPFA